MTAELETALTSTLGKVAHDAGLIVLSAEAGKDFNDKPTARFRLALTPDAPAEKTLELELSDEFNFQAGALLPTMTQHLQEAAKRLKNPRPDAYVTLMGLPISFAEFRWPFHHSASGADSFIVHGTVRLEDGSVPPLHAKISASMTVTFAEIVPAPEQPYAESFIYNAVRKILDQGQLEMLKSGNRQPVPVTTRYYSRWQKKFFFADSTEETRREFLKLKVYWLSGALGGGAPVWIADPRDAQYLNTTAEEMARIVLEMERDGLMKMTEDYASATPKLMESAEEFKAKMVAALAVTKPEFNEEMRHGHTNM
jgi:hypothetical protein